MAALFAAAQICGVGLAGGASVQRFAPSLNPQQALAVDILLSVEIPVKLEGRGFAVLGRWDLTAGQVQCGVEMGGFPTKGGHRLRRAADHQHAEHAEHLNMLNMRKAWL